jgi:hypothetical protein
MKIDLRSWQFSKQFSPKDVTAYSLPPEVIFSGTTISPEYPGLLATREASFFSVSIEYFRPLIVSKTVAWARVLISRNVSVRVKISFNLFIFILGNL